MHLQHQRSNGEGARDPYLGKAKSVWTHRSHQRGRAARIGAPGRRGSMATLELVGSWVGEPVVSISVPLRHRFAAPSETLSAFRSGGPSYFHLWNVQAV